MYSVLCQCLACTSSMSEVILALKSSGDILQHVSHMSIFQITAKTYCTCIPLIWACGMIYCADLAAQARTIEPSVLMLVAHTHRQIKLLSPYPNSFPHPLRLI